MANVGLPMYNGRLRPELPRNMRFFRGRRYDNNGGTSGQWVFPDRVRQNIS